MSSVKDCPLSSLENVFATVDLLLKIFTFLPFGSLIRCEVVSKHWYKIAQNPSSSESCDMTQFLKWHDQGTVTMHVSNITRFRYAKTLEVYICLASLNSNHELSRINYTK